MKRPTASEKGHACYSRAVPPSRIVKRPPSERKRLPPALEAFARGDEQALRRRPERTIDRGRLHDDRPAGLIPGVRNRDARAVYDARVVRLRDAVAGRPAQDAALVQGLIEAIELRLWRARNVTGPSAFVEQVVGIARSEVDALLGARKFERLDDVFIATWLGAEAALLESDPRATVTTRIMEDRRELVLTVSSDHATQALASLGRRLGRLGPPKKL